MGVSPSTHERLMGSILRVSRFGQFPIFPTISQVSDAMSPKSHKLPKTNPKPRKLENPRKVGVFLNSDRRQHQNTASDDLQRQFKQATNQEMLFKLSFENIFSERNRKGTAERYIVISVRQSDVDAAK